jgi:lipopolysaccharide/colanic/teichoic acid biosynthesis glycosyltransferase
MAAGPTRPYRGKRLLDLVVLAAAAIPATLLGVVCAVAVRLTSRGPVLFLQERVGMNGQPFVVWKFRTMLDGDNPIIPSADRITAVGRFLRRTSLDELPQLVNVARGEMSVVGPRPTLAYQVERWTERQKHRLDVRPGLTGLAQVNGRNNLSWPERIAYDLEYVETQSLRTDFGILVRTATAMIGGEGTGATAADDPIAGLRESGAA